MKHGSHGLAGDKLRWDVIGRILGNGCVIKTFGTRTFRPGKRDRAAVTCTLEMDSRSHMDVNRFVTGAFFITVAAR
jgi:hypothetical protein